MKQKKCKVNTVYQATEMIFIFMITSLQQKMMNWVIKIEILTEKQKERKKKQQRKNLAANLLAIILMRKSLMFLNS